MHRGGLREKINISTVTELLSHLKTSTPKTKAMACDVLFNDMTYQETAEKYGVTKQAIYELLKRLYQRKECPHQHKKHLNS